VKINLDIVSFPLKVPFAITGHPWTRTDTLGATIEDRGFTGRGEAVGSYYLNETAQSMAGDLEEWLARLPNPLTPEHLREAMPVCGARNALDCALWDLRCKSAGRSIFELLGMEPRPLRTVFTIGLDEPAIMAERAAAASTLPDLKIKLDGDRPVERLEAIRAQRPDARLVVDVNQGWSFAELKEYLPACERLGVAMIEQPLPRGADQELRGFAPAVPLGADETCLSLEEFPGIADRYRVLNIKLDKCGGLTEGLALARAAQEAGMDLMVGNMTGSSLSMAPSFVIGLQCRFVDIDGPLLQTRDIEHGLDFGADGLVQPPASALWG
jgi:L-alanine-DL-glutamate epimerase-like enolase superfamily enzyme